MADEVEVLMAFVEVSVVAFGVAVAAFVADSLHGKHWQTKQKQMKQNRMTRNETKENKMTRNETKQNKMARNETKQNYMEKMKRLLRFYWNDYRSTRGSFHRLNAKMVALQVARQVFSLSDGTLDVTAVGVAARGAVRVRIAARGRIVGLLGLVSSSTERRM